MEEKQKRKGRPPSGKPHKEPRLIRLEAEFEASLVAAAYWARISVNEIFEKGAAIYLKQLEVEHNQGKSFPALPEVARLPHSKKE